VYISLCPGKCCAVSCWTLGVRDGVCPPYQPLWACVGLCVSCFVNPGKNSPWGSWKGDPGSRLSVAMNRQRPRPPAATTCLLCPPALSAGQWFPAWRGSCWPFPALAAAHGRGPGKWDPDPGSMALDLRPGSDSFPSYPSPPSVVAVACGLSICEPQGQRCQGRILTCPLPDWTIGTLQEPAQSALSTFKDLNENRV
jgi:hypothetical protein